MPVFPSTEWAEAFCLAINANARYAEAAKAWEGDILLLVLPDSGEGPAPGVHLDLAHGRCRSAQFLPDARQRESEFVYSGTRSNWARAMRREIDPVRAILDGTFTIRGNLAKAFRFSRAAKELVETAAAIPTEG